ncbi:uncharacterized protein LOC9629701 [Selaginella moellendorffii]|nr:uncharacterized protein LOC9629701 [Selaginella moellendorffii]|eukprot:XP_002961439.2 uncharacterized protein LOC9629701 [Selaginella moellendorffii]
MDFEVATLCCHSGKPLAKGSAKQVLCLASANKFDKFSDYAGAAHVYRRYGSPNTKELGDAIAALEGGESGLACSSGMGAILAALLAVCKRGDVLVAPRDPYGGTYDLLVNDFDRFGISVRLEDVLDLVRLDATLSELYAAATAGASGRIAVFVEMFSNPLVKVADIPAISKLCKKYGCVLIVDNTFGTPVQLKPLKQGADMVVHSATKFLGGHNDAMAGALVGSSEYVTSAAGMVARWGLAASPFDSWLVLRGIQTLEVRIQRQWQSASILSQQLSAHPLPLRVHAAQGCSIVALEVPNGLDGAAAAIDAFQLITLCPSLGGVATTVSHSASSSHSFLPRDRRIALGITDGLLRISVGLEHVDDIWVDLERGIFAAAAASHPGS